MTDSTPPESPPVSSPEAPIVESSVFQITSPRNDTTEVYRNPPHVLPGTYADWKERLKALPGYLASERQREFMFQLGACCTIGIELELSRVSVRASWRPGC